ncbi:MAG: ComF family protein [Mogibacterium sp.]|nr:ComF family protein [Mogibacterium sp.]
MGIDRLNRIAGAALDLIYPPALYCVCCGKIIDETRCYRLCNECMDGIKWIGSRVCVKCGRRLNESNPTDTCFNCREHPHNYDRGYTCTEYGTHERAMVFALKYDGRSDIASVIGEIMADRMLAEFTPCELQTMFDVILPVPVHPHKRNRRGYNQAALIADEFARRTGLRSDDTVLARVKETHVMKYLGPDQRRENIRGAFLIRAGRGSAVAGRRILLLDDIYTTGATVDELAHLLKSNGAAEVDFLTFASGADMIKA